MDCTDDLDAVYAPDSHAGLGLADEADRDEVGEALAASCEDGAGDVLEWVSTERTARDLDVIREALGEDQLNLLGYSYGTYLGGTYADLFPDRVRVLVLDGAADPTLDGVEQFIQQAGSGETALVAVLEDCAADRSCPFNDGSDLLDRFDELMADIDADPIPAGDGHEVGPGEAHLGVFGSLFSAADWPSLAEALADGPRETGRGCSRRSPPTSRGSTTVSTATSPRRTGPSASPTASSRPISRASTRSSRPSPASVRPSSPRTS